MASYNDLLGVNQNLRCDELTIGRSSKIPKINGIGGKIGSLIIEGNLNLPDIPNVEYPSVVGINNLTGALSIQSSGGGGGGGGDVFLAGFGSTKQNVYTDDTKNEFKGEIVFGTGTAGEPQTAISMVATDRILSVDATGKLVTNTKIPDSSIDFTSGQFMELAGSNTVTATNTFTGVNNFGPQVAGLKVGTAVALYDDLTPANEALIRFQDAQRNNIPAGLSLYGGTGLSRPILFHLTGNQVNDACFEMSRDNDETRFIIMSKEINDVAILDLQVSNDFSTTADHCVIKFTSTNGTNPSNICTLTYLPDSLTTTTGTLKTNRIFQALKTLSIADSNGSQIELQHIDPNININIPIPHFKFTKSTTSTATQMALSSDLTMIRNGDLLTPSNTDVNLRGLVPDKAIGYNTVSGEITYIATGGGGGGDALLAGANIFTALNTFTVGIEAEDTKTVNLNLEDTTDPTKIANIKYTYTSAVDRVIDFDEGIRADIMTTSDSRIRDPSFLIADNRFANIIYKYSSSLENFMQMDTNLKIRSADAAPASSEGTSLTVDTTTSIFGGNPILQPYSILRFRLSDVNNSLSFTDETLHFNAGLDEFDLSKGLNAGGDLTANDGIVKFGDRTIVNPLDLIETTMTGTWQNIVLESNFVAKVDEPVQFRVIEHRRKSYPSEGVGTANLKWYKIEFRGICSVVADFIGEEDLFLFDNQNPNLPWNTSLTTLPPINNRQIVIGSYYVGTLFSPPIIQSQGDQMPCRFIMRGDFVSNPRKCTTGGDSVIGWDSFSNSTISDQAKRKAGTEYLFENAYIWSD